METLGKVQKKKNPAHFGQIQSQNRTWFASKWAEFQPDCYPLGLEPWVGYTFLPSCMVALNAGDFIWSTQYAQHRGEHKN